jgi:glycosyltransferase involved in cell wall biosynthesis
VDISVVIPAFNEEDHVGNLLGDLAGQQTGSISAEVIIADANSTDATPQVARAAGARVIQGGLPAFGRNSGVRASAGRIVYAMDADTRLRDRHFLRKSFAEFQRRRLHCAGMDNRLFWTGAETFWQRLVLDCSFGVANAFIRGAQETRQPRAQGTCMVFERSAFLAVGGFDEKIYWGEDSEIAERMVKRGFRFGVLRSGTIYISPRKPLQQGVAKFVWNAVMLSTYRGSGREIDSQNRYRQMTGIGDYFKR